MLLMENSPTLILLRALLTYIAYICDTNVGGGGGGGGGGGQGKNLKIFSTNCEHEIYTFSFLKVTARIFKCG